MGLFQVSVYRRRVISCRSDRNRRPSEEVVVVVVKIRVPVPVSECIGQRATILLPRPPAGSVLLTTRVRPASKPYYAYNPPPYPLHPPRAPAPGHEQSGQDRFDKRKRAGAAARYVQALHRQCGREDAAVRAAATVRKVRHGCRVRRGEELRVRAHGERGSGAGSDPAPERVRDRRAADQGGGGPEPPGPERQHDQDLRRQPDGQDARAAGPRAVSEVRLRRGVRHRAQLRLRASRPDRRRERSDPRAERHDGGRPADEGAGVHQPGPAEAGHGRPGTVLPVRPGRPLVEGVPAPDLGRAGLPRAQHVRAGSVSAAAAAALPSRSYNGRISGHI